MAGEPGDLEAALDELYGASLEDFVSVRSRLARQFRDAGDPADADALAKLRKPVVAAWVLNQLTRRDRRDVDLLLDAGHRLREAQVGALGGAEKEEFERARKSESEALRRLTREAEKLLSERGSASGSALNQVAASLRAAAISSTGRELLARGRFTEPLRAEGFDVVSELAGEAPPAGLPTRRQGRRQEAAREAREALREAKERLRDAERRSRKAEQEADRLRVEAEQAQRVADEARALVDRAAQEVDAAKRRSGG